MPDNSADTAMEIIFYGTRGSLPAPMSPDEFQAQVAQVLFDANQAGVRFASPAEASAWLEAHLPFHRRSYYGGDTTCFLVKCGDTRVIVDAGTGLRRLGIDLMPDLFRNGGLDLDFLFTHTHLDHVIGFPFFKPLFVPRRKFPVNLRMHGSAAWQNDLQRVLSHTVSAPLFPVELDKLKREAAALEFIPVYDGLVAKIGPEGEITATARRLHHPNETYGWRIEYAGKTFVVATDTEPYAGPDRVLAELSAGADVLYTDAQFDREQYLGNYDRVPRVGWGHGYAEWCGEFSRDSGALLTVAGHHDPESTNARIREIGDRLQAVNPNSLVGYDGLRVRIDERHVIAAGAGEAGQDLIIAR